MLITPPGGGKPCLGRNLIFKQKAEPPVVLVSAVSRRKKAENTNIISHPVIQQFESPTFRSITWDELVH